MKPALFSPGQPVVTAGVAKKMNEDDVFYNFVHDSYSRHLCGDWGNVCDEDKAMNDTALETCERLLSSYGEGPGRIWIITEADRSVTTVLFPDEY